MLSDLPSAICTFLGFGAICLLMDPGGSSLMTGMIAWFAIVGFSVFAMLLTSGSGWRVSGLSPRGLVLGSLAWIAFAGLDRVTHPARVENVTVLSSAEKQRADDSIWITVLQLEKGGKANFYPGSGPMPEIGKTYQARIRQSLVGTHVEQLNFGGEDLPAGSLTRELNGIAPYVCLIAIGTAFASLKLKPMLSGALLVKEITLKPDDAPVTPTPAGFTLLGHFSCPQMRGLRLSAFWSEEHQLCAVAYEHPARPAWIDVVSRYADGSTATCTSMAPSGLEQDPRHPNLYCPGSPLEVLLAKHLESRPPEPLPMRDADEFEASFCRTYREAMQWRMARGVSREEIRRVAAASGKEVSEEVLDFAHRNMAEKLKDG